MRRRVFARTFAGYAALSFLALAVFAVYTLRLARGLSYDALTRGLESAARTALVAVQPLMAAGRSAELDALASSLVEIAAEHAGETVEID